MIIKKCGCDGYLGNKQSALYQDSLYGEGVRAHNVTQGDTKKSRCTVCGKETSAGDKKK